MATKRKIATAKPVAPPTERRGLDPHEVMASATVQAVIGMEAWSGFAGKPDLTELIVALRKQVEQIGSGDMSRVEAMLYGQAMTLQTLFTNLSRRAANQEYLTQFQAYLGLAFKAQAQCRATLEALAEIKNPRQVAFVKQANIAHQQQVNNGAAPSVAHAGNVKANRNELLEASNGERLDTGAQGQAGGAHPHLEAVGAVNRTAHAGGQGQGVGER